MDSNYSDQEKKKLIDDWFSSGGYDQLVINSRKTCSDSAMYSREDALAHMLEYFYSLALEKQWKIYQDGGIERYITRGLAMQVKSSTSSFYHKYRKPLIKEREIVNERGEEFHPDHLNDDQELEGRMKCLMFLYNNELNMVDRWLVEEKVFKNRKNPDIIEEYGISEKDLTNQWTTLKARLKRSCKSY